MVRTFGSVRLWVVGGLLGASFPLPQLFNNSISTMSKPIDEEERVGHITPSIAVMLYYYINTVCYVLQYYIYTVYEKSYR